MIVTIKITNTQLNSIIYDRLDIVCKKLEKINKVKDPDVLRCNFEIAKISNHHRKGNIYRAEINFSLKGKTFRAESLNKTPLSALDATYDILKNEIITWKEKRQSKLRRVGLRNYSP